MNKKRQELILDKMSKVINPDTGKPYLTKEECEAAKAEPLNFTDTSGDASELVKTDGIEINNWFVEQLIKDVTTDLAQAKSISYEAAQRLVNNSGYQIYCTMDPDIQKIAEDVYADLSNLNVHSAKGHQLQSGITIMDPYTGNIVGMVGAMGPKDPESGGQLCGPEASGWFFYQAVDGVFRSAGCRCCDPGHHL